MKQTVIDQVELLGNRNIRVRLKKQIVVDGETLDVGFHRTGEILAGCDSISLSTGLAEVAAHLQEMGYPLSVDWGLVIRTANAHWTPTDALNFKRVVKEQAEINRPLVTKEK